MPYKIRFGVFLPFYSFKTQDKTDHLFNQLQNVVLECERLGYHSVWLDDHLMFNKTQILECWTTLSALSMVTKKMRLGTMATCNSFRNPALLAKMASTVDKISNGRLEFGIGAGVQKNEHNAYGFSFPSSKVRIEKLNEALEIIKKMWTQEKTDFNGKYYRIINSVCEPKPIQKPHPPIIVCGGGEKFTLKVTAKFGNRYDWGYIPSLEDYKHKLKILKKHCNTVGRDFDDIEKSCWPVGQLFIGDDNDVLERKIKNSLPKGVSLKKFMQTNFVGNTSKFLQHIHPYLHLGVTHFMLYFGDLPDMKGMKLFAEKVINKKIN